MTGTRKLNAVLQASQQQRDPRGLRRAGTWAPTTADQAERQAVAGVVPRRAVTAIGAGSIPVAPLKRTGTAGGAGGEERRVLFPPVARFHRTFTGPRNDEDKKIQSSESDSSAAATLVNTDPASDSSVDVSDEKVVEPGTWETGLHEGHESCECRSCTRGFWGSLWDVLASSFSKSRQDDGFQLYVGDDVPEWLQEPFIVSGYRVYTSWEQNWRSMFRWHNETMNIHTHFIPAIAAIIAIIYIACNMHPQASAADKFALAAYVAGAGYCFMASTMFHTHLPQSPVVFCQFCGVDTTGIAVLVAASSLSVTYYLHVCNSHNLIIYSSLILFFCSLAILGPRFKFWSSPGVRVFRTGGLAAVLAVCCAPLVHLLIEMGFGGVYESGPWFKWQIATVAFLMGGMVVFLTRFPECFSPGTFDYIGGSHSIWHILIVFCCFCQARTVYELFLWRLEQYPCNP
ncbi:HlyIII-domain-containing protein [Gonapodya prolifera JEL478]|uniref:HlyIII-domain-containing protein n=1 Tax=Gonapodya prolifera (strain JEL478) TaxID=1344416 RepID=A0A139AHX5_GONPJ|nr:HlyIII-domain-containing protein [Gonapodya prolifera JEL478]|eukprot:KXS16432.1 HlyIII-domain-containing protein [Gonapodya prolifera JEL478]